MSSHRSTSLHSRWDDQKIHIAHKTGVFLTLAGSPKKFKISPTKLNVRSSELMQIRATPKKYMNFFFRAFTECAGPYNCDEILLTQEKYRKQWNKRMERWILQNDSPTNLHSISNEPLKVFKNLLQWYFFLPNGHKYLFKFRPFKFLYFHNFALYNFCCNFAIFPISCATFENSIIRHLNTWNMVSKDLIWPEEHQNT